MQKMAGEKKLRLASPLDQETVVRLPSNKLLSSRAVVKKSTDARPASRSGSVANLRESDFSQVVISTK